MTHIMYTDDAHDERDRLGCHEASCMARHDTCLKPHAKRSFDLVMAMRDPLSMNSTRSSCKHVLSVHR